MQLREDIKHFPQLMAKNGKNDSFAGVVLFKSNILGDHLHPTFYHIFEWST
jgi:hypothetical protein